MRIFRKPRDVKLKPAHKDESIRIDSKACYDLIAREVAGFSLIVAYWLEKPSDIFHQTSI